MIEVPVCQLGTIHQIYLGLLDSYWVHGVGRGGEIYLIFFFFWPLYKLPKYSFYSSFATTGGNKCLTHFLCLYNWTFSTMLQKDFFSLFLLQICSDLLLKLAFTNWTLSRSGHRLLDFHLSQLLTKTAFQPSLGFFLTLQN